MFIEFSVSKSMMHLMQNDFQSFVFSSLHSAEATSFKYGKFRRWSNFRGSKLLGVSQRRKNQFTTDPSRPANRAVQKLSTNWAMRSLQLIILALAISLAANAESSLPSASAERQHFEKLMYNSDAAMEEFARCFSRFEMASALSDQHGMPAAAEEFLSVAYGAYAVSLYFAIDLAAEQSGVFDAFDKGRGLISVLSIAKKATAPDYFQEELLYRNTQLEGFIEVERTAQLRLMETAGKGWGDWVGLKYCLDIQPLQVEVLDRMRRNGVL